MVSGTNGRQLASTVMLISLAFFTTSCSASGGVPANGVPDAELVGRWVLKSGPDDVEVVLEEGYELRATDWPSAVLCNPEGPEETDQLSGEWLDVGDSNIIGLYFDDPCAPTQVGYLMRVGDEKLQIWYYELGVDRDSSPDPEWVLEKIE